VGISSEASENFKSIALRNAAAAIPTPCELVPYSIESFFKLVYRNIKYLTATLRH
jgi:hypothetical protein